MKIDNLLERYDDLTKSNSLKERALYHILKANEEKIISLINDCDIERFHKSFRQIDICGNYNIDLAIWFLLHDAPIFWKMINELTSNEFTDICPICKNETFSIKEQRCITFGCFCCS